MAVNSAYIDQGAQANMRNGNPVQSFGMIRPVRDRWPIEAARFGRFVRASAHRIRMIEPGKWRLTTWGRTFAFTPDAVYAPASLDELVSVVDECGRAGRRLKPAGSLHSWSPCAVTD